MCVSVFLCLLEFQITVFYQQSEDILASSHNFKNLFEGQDLVWRWRLDLGLG